MPSVTFVYVENKRKMPCLSCENYDIIAGFGRAREKSYDCYLSAQEGGKRPMTAMRTSILVPGLPKCNDVLYVRCTRCTSTSNLRVQVKVRQRNFSEVKASGEPGSCKFF